MLKVTHEEMTVAKELSDFSEGMTAMAELISIECELAKKLGLKYIPAERLRTYADDMDIAAVSLKDMLHTCESFLGRFKADGGNIIDPQVLAEGKYRMRALPLECVLNAVDNLSVRAFVLNERARDIDEGAFDIVDECVEWTLECLNDDAEALNGLSVQIGLYGGMMSKAGIPDFFFRNLDAQ